MLLKSTRSLTMELSPGLEWNYEKKDFEWELKRFDQEFMMFDVIFEDPKVISIDTYDTLILTFNNTEFFIESVNDDKLTIPNGFNVTITLPPQENDLIDSVVVESIKDTANTVIIGNVFIKFAFKSTMSVVFGSIISLQILAHLPLSNVVLPARAMECFDIMVQVVSFDYFPLS